MWVEKHRDGWRIRDRVGGKVVVLGSGYATKAAAKDAAATKRADALRGETLVHRGGRITVEQWATAWLPGYTASLKPSSADTEPARLRKHVLPALGRYALDELDVPLVQQWVAGLTAGGLSPKSVRNTHAGLHKMLRAAVAARLIRHNPADGIHLPRAAHREMRFLTQPEIARLLAATPEHYRPLVTTLVGTGMRLGEAMGLRVADVDLLARPGTVRILRTTIDLSNGTLVTSEPKTRAGRRTVALPVEVVDALVPLTTRDGDATLFLTPRGNPIRGRALRRCWNRWTAAAGLSGVRIHDLRHTHAAHLISQGKPLTAIQRRLGHSSVRVTSDTYGHLLPEVDASLVASASASIFGGEHTGSSRLRHDAM